MESARHVESRRANWLPVQFVIGASFVPSVQVDENDNFSKGEVVEFMPNQKAGRVKTANGSICEFDLSEIEIVGNHNSIGTLSSGVRVGYDLSQGSIGMRITKLKLY